MPLSRVRSLFGATLRNVPAIVLSLVALASLLSLLALLALAAGASLARADPSSRTSGRSSSRTHTTYAFSTDDDGDFAYAVFGPHESTINGNMGSRDWRTIRKSTGSEKSDAIWFSLDGRDYVVRDRALIDRAREIVAPMRDLGARQGRLGARQGELGARQGQLGARQGALGARQAALAVRRSLRGDDDRDVERRSIEIEREMDQLAREQDALARLQEPLARQQEDLGRQQERVSKRANADMRRLAEEAITSGRAERRGD